MTFCAAGDFGVYPRRPLHRSIGTSASAAKSCIRSQGFTVSDKGREPTSGTPEPVACGVMYFRAAKTRQEAERGRFIWTRQGKEEYEEHALGANLSPDVAR